VATAAAAVTTALYPNFGKRFYHRSRMHKNESTSAAKRSLLGTGLHDTNKPTVPRAELAIGTSISLLGIVVLFHSGSVGDSGKISSPADTRFGARPVLEARDLGLENNHDSHEQSSAGRFYRGFECTERRLEGWSVRLQTQANWVTGKVNEGE
jgi:hypothetical protein